MKTKFLTLSLLAFLSLPAFASYEPTILSSKEEAGQIFSRMENRFKQVSLFQLRFSGTQCTARAETWAYDMAKTEKVNSQKVFVFYTAAYHAWYKAQHGEKFGWWFHVAPFVVAKNADGTTSELVMDKVFAKTPQTMKDWTDLFIESKQPCIENIPFARFEGDLSGSKIASYDNTAHCYIVRAPMYDMFPADADARERGERTLTDFDLGQVLFASKSLLPVAKKPYLIRTGLKQPEAN